MEHTTTCCRLWHSVQDVAIAQSLNSSSFLMHTLPPSSRHKEQNTRTRRPTIQTAVLTATGQTPACNGYAALLLHPCIIGLLVQMFASLASPAEEGRIDVPRHVVFAVLLRLCQRTSVMLGF